MPEVKAIIMDFDGVIAESNEPKTNAFRELFNLYPKYRDAMMAFHTVNYGSPRMKKFEYYVYELMGRPNDFQTVQTIAFQFSNFVVDRVVNSPDVPGLKVFLNEFSEHTSIYVSSLTPQSELVDILSARGISSFFVDIFGDPPHCKTEVIKTVISNEGITPDQIIYIGDSIYDYNVATENGVQFIGRDSGLSFNGVNIKLHKDLFEIATLVRNSIENNLL